MPTSWVALAPDPTSLPTEPPAGGSGDPGGGAGSDGSTFLTRPSSSPLTYNGDDAVTIDNLSFQDSPLYTNIGITIRNVHGSITISNCDAADLAGWIYIVDCSGTLLITNLRGRNIGDGTIGSGHSNYIQLSRCKFTGSIRNCSFRGGLTEDMISIYQSGGQGVGSELVIYSNRLQGLTADESSPTVRKWTSNSGTGIIVGDGAGSGNNGNVIVRDNTLLTPGQVGLQHIDGSNIYTHDNIVYGEKRVSNNNPITSYGGNPSGTVGPNTYYWTNNDNSHPTPSNGAGTMVFTANVSDSTLVAADYIVTL